MLSLSKAPPVGGETENEFELSLEDSEVFLLYLLCTYYVQCTPLALCRHHHYRLFELSNIRAKSVRYDAFWIILGIIQKVLV